MSDQATIARAPHGKEHPYVMIARETLQDKGISFEAAGMLCELLSRPTDWKVKVSQLRHRGDGKDRVYRIINELIKAGYIRRFDGRNERGHLITHYLVYETKQEAIEAEAQDEPVRKTRTGADNPRPDEPDTENPDTTYNRGVENTELQKLPVDATASTPAPLSTPVENRTAALRDYGNRVAEHIEALPPVSIDDFGKTDPAEGYAVTPPPPRTEPLEEVKTALAELFGWKHEGVLQNYGRMLRGIVSKRKTAYDEYAFIGQPVSADELRAFVASWKRAHPGLDLPQTPDAMARHISAYRAAAQAKPTDPFAGFTFSETPVAPIDDAATVQARLAEIKRLRGQS